jgi:hypothetical protein
MVMQHLSNAALIPRNWWTRGYSTGFGLHTIGLGDREPPTFAMLWFLFAVNAPEHLALLRRQIEDQKNRPSCTQLGPLVVMQFRQPRYKQAVGVKVQTSQKTELSVSVRGGANTELAYERLRCGNDGWRNAQGAKSHFQ